MPVLQLWFVVFSCPLTLPPPSSQSALSALHPLSTSNRSLTPPHLRPPPPPPLQALPAGKFGTTPQCKTKPWVYSLNAELGRTTSSYPCRGLQICFLTAKPQSVSEHCMCAYVAAASAASMLDLRSWAFFLGFLLWLSQLMSVPQLLHSTALQAYPVKKNGHWQGLSASSNSTKIRFLYS